MWAATIVHVERDEYMKANVYTESVFTDFRVSWNKMMNSWSGSETELVGLFHTCEEDRAHKGQQGLFQGEPGTSCCDSGDGDRGREGRKEEMGGAAWTLQQSICTAGFSKQFPNNGVASERERERERQAADSLSPLWVQHLFESTVSVCFVLCHHVCLDPQSICTLLSVLIPPLWASVRVQHESFPQKSSWRVEAAKQPDCLQHESTLNAFTQRASHVWALVALWHVCVLLLENSVY